MKIQEVTDQFVQDADELKDLVGPAQEEVLRFSKLKNDYKEEAEFLEHDRGKGVTGSIRYEESIGDFIELARFLEKKQVELQNILMNFGNRLNDAFFSY